jgi:Icc-related predicted phosphoesterase
MAKLVKIAAVSDLHGELNFKMPIADILTISGDICPVRGSHKPIAQMNWINAYFLPWADKLIKDGIYKHVVFTPGNHDFAFTKVVNYNPDSIFNLVLPKDVYYLCNKEVILEGVRIYGTPWTPTFGNWAFMLDEDLLDNIFNKIPKGLDILISHGPARGYNDTILQYGLNEQLGSTTLIKHVKRTSPKWLFVGHIHSGNHKVSKIITDNDSMTNSVNVSLLNEDYEIAYPVFTTIIEVE